jgi:hypothetical protein
MVVIASRWLLREKRDGRSRLALARKEAEVSKVCVIYGQQSSANCGRMSRRIEGRPPPKSMRRTVRNALIFKL